MKSKPYNDTIQSDKLEFAEVMIVTYRDAICKAAEQYTSFYLYNEQQIIENITMLKEHFPSVEFLYSMKCNSYTQVVSSIFSQGFGADAASLGEAETALGFGLQKDQIFYSAPGKSKSDIQKAFGRVNLIADSITEIERIEMIAEKEGLATKIGIRINPAFTFDGGCGVPSKFGIDEKDVFQYLQEVDPSRFVKINGIHIHVKSQELSAEKLNQYYENVFRLAEKVEEALGHALDYINFGSGIGIPYASNDTAVDIEWLGKQMEEQISFYRKAHPTTRIMIELGRYLVGKSGVYVTHVADRKVSHGKTYIILQNTLNGFLRPSLARLIEKYSANKDMAGTEPLFTGFDSFGIETVTKAEEYETVTLVGNLCTAADVIAENIRLPKLDEDDIVIITNAGSYAAVLSPMQFSSQEMPKQLMLSKDGELR